MKKISLIMMGIISMFLISCSNMQIGFEEDSIFYNGGIVYIYLDNKKSQTNKYKVYINNEDTDISLLNHIKTRFGVQEGQTKIEIKEGQHTAQINLFLSKSTNYYLKVIKNKNNAIKIIQVQKSDINANAKETPLYTDEKVQHKSEVKKDRAIISDYGEEPMMQEQNSSVNENTKVPDNGDTIFYYNAEDGE